MTTNNKKEWRESWLSCINQLTSFDLQKTSWLDRSHSNPHWSFVEFMCGYFDGLSLDDNYLIPLENGWVTTREFEIIKDWHKKLDEYHSPKNDDYDNEAVLNDPKWIEILQTGVSVRNKLAEILDGVEKQFLIEKINYLKYV